MLNYLLYFSLLFVAIVLVYGLRVIKEYQRGILFTLGRFSDVKSAGLRFIVPVFQTMTNVDVRTITVELAQQETITKDNVPVKVTAVIWYRVVDPKKALIEVSNFNQAVSSVALTMLRNIIGQHSMDDVLKERDQISTEMQVSVDRATEPWGVKVEMVEMQNVEIPASMQRVMAQEAEALREKRARIIKAEAEMEAAQLLRNASEIMMQTPAALELRRMQMITEVGAEQNTMTIIMVPSDFINAANGIASLAKGVGGKGG